MSPHPLLAAAVALAWVAAIDLCALALGARILRRCVGERSLSLAESLGLACVLGLSALAMLVFALGALQVLYPALLVVLVAVGALAGWRELRGQLRADGRGTHAPAPRAWRDPALWACALLLSAHFAVSFEPRLEHDSLVYHLNLPAIYLRHHALVLWPGSLFANMPHAFELLFTLGYAAGGVTGANLIGFHGGLLTLVGLRAVAIRAGTPALGGVMGLLFLASPLVNRYLTGTLVEAPIGAWTVFAFLLLQRFMSAPDARGFVLFAALAGWIATSKYPAWLWVGALAVAALWALVSRLGDWRERLRLIGLGSAAALLVFLPWGLKSAIATGDPLHPILYPLLGREGWSGIQAMQYRGMIAAPVALPPAVAEHKRLLFAPDVVLRPARRLTKPVSPVVAVLFLLAPLAAWLAWRRRGRGAPSVARDAALAALACGWSALSAFIGSPFTSFGRYLGSCMPLLVLAAALPFAPLLAARTGRVVALLVALGACAWQFDLPRPDWSVFTREGRERALAATPTWLLMQRLERELPPDARVLFAYENRTFPLPLEHDYDSIYQAPACLRRIAPARTPQEAAALLHAQGYTHVVFNSFVEERVFSEQRSYRLTDPDLYTPQELERERQLLRAMLSEATRLLFTDGVHSVHALEAQR